MSALAPTRPWNSALALALALALSITIIATVEVGYRAQGQSPTVFDDKDLWAQERARLQRLGPRALALVGTSRMVFGVDPAHLRTLLPGYEPVMLAINGTYPAAALRDLAHDPSFVGTVVVDIDAAGLRREYRELQSPWVEHFRRDFGPSRAVHRRLLTEWQMRMLVSDPDHALVPVLRRAMAGKPAPARRYATIGRDRAGWLNLSQVDTKALASHFARERRALLQAQPAPTPDSWLSDLTPVADWVRAIHARGGQVLIFGMPTSGEHRAVDEAAFPRRVYWDRLASAIGAPVVHADEVSLLTAIPTPDGSHVDATDRHRLTEGLALVIRQRLRVLSP